MNRATPHNQTAEPFDQDESQRRFEAALRGARAASPRPMSEFIGKGKRATDQGRSRVKKTAPAKPK
jgi:hypothetical protein